MYKIITNISLLIVLTIALLSSVIANEGIEILEQSPNSIKIRYNSVYIGDSLITQANGLESKLPKFAVTNTELSHKELYPNFVSRYSFIVPSKNAFSISVQNVDIINKVDYELFQNDDAIQDNNSEELKLKYSDNISNRNLPCYIEYKGIARNQHIAQLVINPAKYNPFQKRLSIYKSLEITINFDLYKVKIAPKINDFNSISAINYEMAKRWVASNNFIKLDKDRLLSPDNTMASVSNGQWAKIIIEEEGLYRLSPEDLQSIGIPSTPTAAQTLKIFGNGGKPLSEKVSDGKNNNLNEQEIIVNTKSDGSIESVIFYAGGTTGFEKVRDEIVHYRNWYSVNNSYLITWGGEKGKRAIPKSSPIGDIANKPNSYIQRVLFEEELINPYSPGAGRDWFGRSYFSTSLPPTMLYDLDRTGDITYKFALAHRAEAGGYFTVSENNEQIGNATLPAIGSYTEAVRGTIKLKVSASKIASDNRSVINLKYSSSQLASIGYLDYYELFYPRKFFAINNTIEFIADESLEGITEYNINGFSGNIYGYDVSDLSNPKLLTNKSNTGGIFTFTYDLSKDIFSRFYISSQLKKPKLEIIQIANLRDNDDNSPIVVITHPDLYESAVQFKEYREQSLGKKVSIYRTDHIYNEYASGVEDITALRDFMIDIYNRWETKPEYLVLWGDGHYDYKNIASNRKNYIPAYQTYRPNIIRFDAVDENYATDDYLALLDGDDLIVDLNFGRITIDKPELGFWIVDKIKHYESSSSDDAWRTNLILVGDDGPIDKGKYDGSTHTDQSESLQENVVSRYYPDMQYDKIYLVEYPIVYVGSGRSKPGVTEEMLSKINTSGGLLLNWIGHGNPRVWAHEQILDRDVTIPQMKNLDKLFFLTAATCDFARFDDPEVRSGAEDLFLSKVGGAIGVFSATRVVYSESNAKLVRAFYKSMLDRDPATGEFPSLGKVINSIKQEKYGDNDRKFLLIGDPTMTLLFPDYKIKVNSINSNIIDDDSENIELNALSRVKVIGEVLNPITNTIDESYNGTIVVTLRDGDQDFKVIETFQKHSGTFNFTKLGGSLNQSAYRVENGRFEAEFIVPKDISYSDTTSRLFLYSASEDGKYGSGSYHKLIINGFDNSQIMDTIPPEIDIYLDSRDFKSGDYVTSNPRLIIDLFDESGINTTGLGIGHNIEAWIDDSQESIVLTSKFHSSLTDSRRGTVEDILYGLSVGKHKIKVRAWDVFNNYAVAEVNFVISKSRNGGLISDMINYPNPFSEGTNIEFRHNANPPFDVRLDIYSTSGRLVRTINETLNTFHTSHIFWNGLDDYSNSVSDGMYFYIINVNSDDDNSIGRGKLIKVRN